MGSIDGQLQYFNPNTLDGLNPVYQEISGNALLVDGTNMMLADLDMNNHQIKNLDAGIASTDAVNVGQLAAYALDATVVHLGGTETITGAKTFQTTLTASGSISMNNSKITLLANGTVATDAATYGQLTSGLANYLPLAGGTMSGQINMGSQKITSLANGTVPTDAAAYGQLTSVDGNCVHLTGNETISGIKTFTSSPIVPAQPTTLTQASSLKMDLVPRHVAWAANVNGLIKNPGGGFSVATDENVAYAPYDLGTAPLDDYGFPVTSTPHELHIAYGVMQAGLTLSGMIVHAVNYRSPSFFGAIPSWFGVKVAIWDDTLNLVAQSAYTELEWVGAPIPQNSYRDDYFYVQFTSNYTPTVSGRYYYGVWYQNIINSFAQMRVRKTQVNNADVLQTTYGWAGTPKLASGKLTGVTALPNPLTNSGWVSAPGLWTFMVVGQQESQTIW